MLRNYIDTASLIKYHLVLRTILCPKIQFGAFELAQSLRKLDTITMLCLWLVKRHTAIVFFSQNETLE